MKSILCILAATLVTIAGAAPVTSSQAGMVAGAWAARNASFGFAEGAVAGGIRSHKDANGVKLWYEVPMTDGSCLIVSPVTELGPVIVALENVPEKGLDNDHPMLAMLAIDMTDRLKKLGLYSEKTGTSLMGASAPAAERSPLMEKWAKQGEAKWARYGVGTGPRLMASETEVLDSVTTEVYVLPGFEKDGALTHWNQSGRAGGYCYNYYTPEHCVCGCVATAMAAMLQYFGVKSCKENEKGAVPATFNGSETYDGKPFKTMGGDYDWSILADKKSLSSYNQLTDDQRKLLGRVAYDCGVAVGMAWAPGASGAFESNIPKAFKDLFGFKAVRDVMHPTADHYPKLIYNQCRAGAPVGLSIHKEGGGSGHSVLAVGYGIDEDGNPRVRVFVGWGGSGDGWYALPYIDTNGTYDGDSVAYDIIQDVATMIDYETDETVPIVGQMIPASSGMKITLPGVPDKVPSVDGEGNPVTDEEGNPAFDTVDYRTLETIGNGYFATRVSESEMAGKEIKACFSNVTEDIVYESAVVQVGDNIAEATKPDEICEALPDELLFVLLKNTKYALSFSKAIEIAKADNKAILRVSTNGSVSNRVGELSQVLIGRILELDKANGDGAGFADRFVYQPIEATSSTERDGQITFGVFLPDEASVSERWAWYNGRLAYGYGFSAVGEIAATDEEGVDVSATNNFFAVTNEGFAATYFAKGIPVTTNDVALTFDEDGLNSAFQFVLDKGWEEYARETADIVLTVMGSPVEAGVADPAFGTYTNKFAAGEEIAVKSPGLQTNEAAGVVMDYRSGLLEVSNVVSGVTSEPLKISDATNLTFAAGDVATLTWQGVTNAVWIKVTDKDNGGTTYRDGSIAPASGWYEYGETVVLVSVPTNEWAFSHWSGGSTMSGLLKDYVGASGIRQPALTFVAEKPMDIDAGYVERDDETKAEELAEKLSTTNVLRVSSSSADANVPSTDVTLLHDSSTTALAPGDEMDVSPVPILLRLQSDTFTDAAGDTWECERWELLDGGKKVASGYGSAAGLTPDAATNDVRWVWVKQVADEEEREPAEVPTASDGVSSPLTIYSNADGTLTVEAAVGNAVKGWWYVLKTATSLAGPYTKAVESAEGDACAVLAEKDGSLLLRTTFTPTDEKRFYKVTVEGDAP